LDYVLHDNDEQYCCTQVGKTCQRDVRFGPTTVCVTGVLTEPPVLMAADRTPVVAHLDTEVRLIGTRRTNYTGWPKSHLFELSI